MSYPGIYQIFFNKKIQQDGSNDMEMIAMEDRSPINVELVVLLENSNKLSLIKSKETLQNIYQEYHRMEKQEIYFQHVKDVTTDSDMIEIAIDEAWDAELIFHDTCQKTAMKCLRKKITNENLFIWTGNHLPAERGLSFKVKKFLRKIYPIKKLIGNHLSNLLQQNVGSYV